MASLNSIWKQNQVEKRLRPFGDRSVEFIFSFVFNKDFTPRVGYVEEKQYLVLSS